VSWSDGSVPFSSIQRVRNCSVADSVGSSEVDGGVFVVGGFVIFIPFGDLALRGRLVVEAFLTEDYF
jgi:hypothetical protein